MAWDENKGNWFSFGPVRFPELDTWKDLSAVKGAIRTGGIVAVDKALDVLSKEEKNLIIL